LEDLKSQFDVIKSENLSLKEQISISGCSSIRSEGKESELEEEKVIEKYRIIRPH